MAGNQQEYQDASILWELESLARANQKSRTEELDVIQDEQDTQNERKTD